MLRKDLGNPKLGILGAKYEWLLCFFKYFIWFANKLPLKVRVQYISFCIIVDIFFGVGRYTKRVFRKIVAATIKWEEKQR